jgi:hypothetical protein
MDDGPIINGGRHLVQGDADLRLIVENRPRDRVAAAIFRQHSKMHVDRPLYAGKHVRRNNSVVPG